MDGDGSEDVFLGQNFFATQPETPRLDAGRGLWLKGDGHGRFTAVPPVESGFLAARDVTGLALIKTPTGRAVLVANNGDSLRTFAIARP